MGLDLDLIQTILTALGGSGAIGGGTWAFNYFRKKIKVKLVSNPNDVLIDDFILLYDEVIEENTRILPEEITKFIGNSKPTEKVKLCDYLYFCTKEKKLIGFLKFMYCHKENYLFIAYLGIDKKNEIARQEASIALYGKLQKLLKKDFKNCKAIFFEVENSTNGQTSCKAKKRLFKNATSRFNLPFYIFDFDYVQPEMPSDNQSIMEEKSELMFVPLGRNLNRHTSVSKESMLEYLHFIYQKIYGRVHEDRDLNTIYQNYLDELLNKYEQTLPNKILLKQQ